MNKFAISSGPGDVPQDAKVKVNVPAETERGEAGIPIQGGMSATAKAGPKSNLAMAGAAIMSDKGLADRSSLVKKKTEQSL